MQQEKHTMNEQKQPGDATGALSPVQQLRWMILGYQVTYALRIVAELGIADLLAQGPRPVQELADQCGVHADGLYRVLRALAGEGVFAEEPGRAFRLTPMAACLCSERADTVRWTAMMHGRDARAWDELMHCLHTGEACYPRVFDHAFFDDLAQDTAAAKVFNRAMSGVSALHLQGVLAAYPFAETRVLADLAGGHGALLAGILERHEHLQGILLEQPQVLAGAETALAERGLGERCRLQACDFFEAVPPGADTYMMKSILHDWSDEQALRILHNCRRVVPRDGRLLSLDAVLPEDNTRNYGKWLDLHMLVINAGKERTRSEFAALLAQGGFTLHAVHPTNAVIAVVEALPNRS